MPKKFNWRKFKVPKNHPSADQEDGERQKESGGTNVIVAEGVKVDFVDDLKEQHEAERYEANTHNQRQLRWTKITAGLVFGYALVTLWQGCLTREAINNSSKQFRVDERPYVVKEWIRILKPVVGERLTAAVLWKNTGRTPALHGRLYMAVDILAKDPADTNEWARKAREESKGYVEIGTNLDRSTSVTGQTPLSGIDMDRILHPTHYVYVFGAFVYDDVFHESHETDFCGRYLPDTAPEVQEMNGVKMAVL